MSWNKWDKSSIIAKLKEYHRAGINLNVQKDLLKHDSLLTRAIARHFDSYAQAMAAAGIEYVPFRRTWDKEKIVVALQRYYREGVRLSSSGLQQHDNGLFWVTLNHFGSYRKALKAAGIDYRQFLPYREWTRPKIIAALRRFHRKGIPLHLHELVKHDNGLAQAAYNHFGSYGAAIEAAGLDYERVRRHRSWTRDQVIERLKEMHREGDDLSPTYLLAHGNVALYDAAMVHCGSYRKALKAAEIDERSAYRPKNRIWPADRVLNMIKQYHVQGKDLSFKAMSSREERGLTSGAARHFGSWRAALEKVGIDYRQVAKSRKWSREEIITGLQALHASGEYMLHDALCKTKHRRLVFAAQNVFGTWTKALEAAGVPPLTHRNRINNRKHWTDALILERLRELHRNGEDLRDRVAKTRYMPLYYAAREHFGTYINAVAQAGIDYDRVVQRALRKQRQRAKAS